MLEIEAALKCVLTAAAAWQDSADARMETVALNDATGRVLHALVQSDIDSPPFAKSLRDGYAVRSEDINAGITEFEIVDEILAGGMPSNPVGKGTAARIMTGAPMPQECDSVVMVEKTSPVDPAGKHVQLADPQFIAGQHVLPRAQVVARGSQLFEQGRLIAPRDIGVLAEFGAAQVQVTRKPRIAVIATGDELVDASERPSSGAIRNSNGPMLEALIRSAGGEPHNLGIIVDELATLRAGVKQALENDIVLLCGGVSAGVRDLAPQVFEGMGVEKIFHKIRLKPGKPLWFGKYHREPSPVLVFGLPGNPVSGLVCFELFVKPAIARFLRQRVEEPVQPTAVLCEPFKQQAGFVTWWPAVVENDGARNILHPLPWHGSADLLTLSKANCLAKFPAGRQVIAAETEIPFLPLG